MEPKRSNLEIWSLLLCLPKNCFDFVSFWGLFGIPLGLLWPPFWLPSAPFGIHVGPLWVPLGFLLAVFVILWPPVNSLGLVLGSPGFSSPAEAKFRQDLAKILPRFCREIASGNWPLARPRRDARSVNNFSLNAIINLSNNGLSSKHWKINHSKNQPIIHVL